MLVRLYNGCWARIYVFSPSLDLDSAWLPVKKYVEDGLKVDPKKEKCFYSEWDPAALQDIVDTEEADGILQGKQAEEIARHLHRSRRFRRRSEDHARGRRRRSWRKYAQHPVCERSSPADLYARFFSKAEAGLLDDPSQPTIPLRLEAAEPARA